MAKQLILPDVVCKVEKSGNRFNAWSTDGVKYTSEITHGCRKNAFNGNYLIGRFPSSNGNSGFAWRRITDKILAELENNSALKNTPITDDSVSVEVPSDHAEVLNFIHSSYSLKPKGLMMSELKWKYLIRSGVRGKNIMMTGPAGCGKTMAAKSLVNALDRPDFYFNLGATQDPRATLIGNVQFQEGSGTYLAESLFVKAIQTPNAVILLDELSRAHPDAWNILMTVLDSGQRYLRLDEQKDQATIKVAEGVTFIATANIGNEYTSTRVMDKALMDRFTIVEMDVLNDSEELGLLTYLYPNVDPELLKAVSEIAHSTRVEASSEDGKFASGVSTRTSVEMGGLLFDGFGIDEAAEVCVYPQFDSSGGADSERTFIKQLVQKYVSDGSDENLFNEEEINETEAEHAS